MLEVLGNSVGSTVSWTGTCCSNPFPCTSTFPWYSPGLVPSGTSTSTQIARDSPFGTLKGKALRSSPSVSSLSGTSGSGQGPLGELGKETCVMLRYSWRYSCTFSAPMVDPEPVSPLKEARTPSSGALSAVTTIWKATYSFRAATRSTGTFGGGDAWGRTFAEVWVVVICAAKAEAEKRQTAATAKCRRVVVIGGLIRRALATYAEATESPRPMLC